MPHCCRAAVRQCSGHSAPWTSKRSAHCVLTPSLIDVLLYVLACLLTLGFCARRRPGGAQRRLASQAGEGRCTGDAGGGPRPAGRGDGGTIAATGRCCERRAAHHCRTANFPTDGDSESVATRRRRAARGTSHAGAGERLPGLDVWGQANGHLRPTLRRGAGEAHSLHHGEHPRPGTAHIHRHTHANVTYVTYTHACMHAYVCALAQGASTSALLSTLAILLRMRGLLDRDIATTAQVSQKAKLRDPCRVLSATC